MSHRALVAALALICAVSTAGMPAAHAGLVGGLTSLPRTGEASLSDLQNGGFETVNTVGGRLLPQNWTPAAGFDAAWSADSSERNNGQYSMKMLGIAGAEAYQVVYLPAGSYKFTGYIKTSTSGSGRARLMMDLRTWRYQDVTGCTADCGINFWTTSQELGASRTGTFQLVTTTITITDADIASSKPSKPGLIKAFAVLDGYWASNRLTAWYDDVNISYQQSFPLDVFMQYPNYRGMVFTDQDETLRFRVGLNDVPPSGTSYTVQGTLRLEGGNVVETVTRTVDASNDIDPTTGKPAFIVMLNNGGANGRPMGSAVGVGYLAEFTLLDGNGNELTPRHPAHRVYRADRAGMKVSFDSKNRVVVSGQPRFILGAYDSALGSVSTSTDWDNLLWDPTGARRMTGLPIDMYINYHLGDTDAPVIDALMDHLAPESHGPAPGWSAPGQTGPWVNAGGTHYLQTGNCFSNFSADGHNNGLGFKIDQQGYITNPAPNGIGGKALGYYTADECTPDMVDGVFKQYQRLIGLDPDSMTFGALLGDSSLGLWRDAVDVLSTDPYPMYGAEPAGGYNHGQVAAWTALTRNVVQDSRPFMTVLQFFKFDASRGSQGRWPTKQEMRNHAYMAITEGARGLVWWSLGENALATMCKSGGWCTERVQKMQDLRDVATEISKLETALLADDVTGWGSVSGTAIKAKVKRTIAGTYLFTYNSTSTSTHADFALTTAPASVEVYGEGRTISSSGSGTGSTFGDDYGPFQAHVYILR